MRLVTHLAATPVRGHYKGIRLYCKGLGYSDAEINLQRSRTSNRVNRIPPPLRSADTKRLKG